MGRNPGLLSHSQLLMIRSDQAISRGHMCEPQQAVRTRSLLPANPSSRLDAQMHSWTVSVIGHHLAVIFPARAASPPFHMIVRLASDERVVLARFLVP